MKNIVSMEKETNTTQSTIGSDFFVFCFSPNIFGEKKKERKTNESLHQKSWKKKKKSEKRKSYIPNDMSTTFMNSLWNQTH